MEIRNDPEVDALSLRFNSLPVESSDEIEEGVIVDYDSGGRIIAVEILDASERITNPRAVDFQVYPVASDEARQTVAVA